MFPNADDRALFRLTLGNALVFAVCGFGLLRGVLAGPAVWFGPLALLASAMALALLFALPALAVSRVRGGRTASRLLAPLLFALLQIGLFVDLRVLAIFGAPLTRDLLAQARPLQPREWMGLRTEEVLAFLAICAAIVLLEAIAHAVLLRARSSGPSYSPRWRRLALASTAVLGGTVAIYHVDGERQHLQTVAERLPIFASISLPTEPSMVLVLERELARKFGLLDGPGRVLLPKNPLRTHDPSEPWNVVILVLDSWRADALREDITPALCEFSRGAIRYTRHFSGGNQTSAGMFTLLYGLPQPYARLVTDGTVEPLLLTRLHDLRYRSLVQVGTNLEWDSSRELRRLEPADVRFRYPGKTTSEQDHAMVEDFASFLDTRDPERPFFDLLFISSTHASYSFDERDARFFPYAGQLDYRTMSLEEGERVRGVRNRYWNAVAGADKLAGRIFSELGSHDLLEKTIVVVTGDHGEAFDEQGSWGHGRDLHWQSTRVPLLIRVPGEAPRVVDRLTSHVDLVATILPLLGVENPPADYSAGFSLLAAGGPDHVLSCTEHFCARTEASGTTFFALTTQAPAISTFDASDQRIEPIDPDARRRVVDSFDELSRFVE